MLEDSKHKDKVIVSTLNKEDTRDNLTLIKR